MTFSLSAKIAQIRTITKSTADIFLEITSNLIAALEKNLRNSIPIITGTVTIKNILNAILIKETFVEIFSSPSKFKEVKIMKGIVITLNKLMIAVREIDSATSPFAKEVKIFEVTPPGAAAIIITPTANSGEIAETFSKA